MKEVIKSIEDHVSPFKKYKTNRKVQNIINDMEYIKINIVSSVYEYRFGFRCKMFFLTVGHSQKIGKPQVHW